ncbi:unnamed protein product (macronuclear) [Paramecium tetraurelia]|uniref:Rab-GAP TBC domain-containing protein n=1 Tax=Paramecium tetraurelia TaxID=5888 RepID=A0DZJ7_PARTE|nr:uncharacterized protein GSPATT00021631001 [Paramecium tetraurelia]CAK88464.1 unnamed protein product [Paramecium tetraurelia]|eukprot:XP_001455861.1 hypothetical protein (macronuclear) [Paramecium tetraurelia strain d4-2]
MNPENRDHYGFPKQNTQTPSKEEMLKINARIEKWRKMIPKIPQLMANNDSKLKSRLRKGIPEGIRMLIWPCLAEIDQMKIQAKRTYKELVESQEISPHDSQITLDVMRTFQTNDLIKMDTITSQSLFTVLRAISLTFQDMGYCQGLNYLAGSFLLLMNDELVYWHLYSLLTKYGCLDTYINPTNTLKYFYALDILVKQFLPDLHAKFTKFNIVPFYYAAEWFITLFSSILPMQIFLRVTDIFWHEHHKTTFRASLAILKIRKEEILTAKTMEQAITILKDQKFFNNYDPDKFIKIAMKDFIFSKKDLRKYYDQFAASQKK